jgi:DNA-directed RNA polymerase specialized sigma subunit
MGAGATSYSRAVAATRDPGIHRPDEDELFDALQAVVDAFQATAERSAPMTERLAWLRRQRAEGARFSELARSGERAQLLEAVNATLEGLLTSGTRARRLTAQALYADSMTMDEIAVLLGVSRQRVSRLLHGDPSAPGPPWTRSG